MTGPEHYREAERLIERARSDEAIVVPEVAMMVLADAQVHATLALAAAQAGATLGQFGVPTTAWAEASQ